jgi:Tfp pilus assembly protein PilF
MSKHPFFPILIVLSLLVAVPGCLTTAKKPPAQDVDPATLSAEELEKLGDRQVTQQGEAEQAIQSYGQALAKGGDPARLKYKQGFVLLREGQWTNASERFEESLALSPQDVQTLQGAAYAAFRLGDYGRTESRLSRAVSVRPDLPGAHNLLGITHNYLKQPGLAVADFKAAIALSGPNPDLQNNLGIAYFMLRDFTRAEESFRQALASGPNPKAANNLGLALCGQKKFDAAFEAFKTGGGEAAAYNNTGVCYADAGQKDKALEYFNKAVELSPKYYAAAERNLNQAGGRETAIEAMQTLPAGDLAPPGKAADRPPADGDLARGAPAESKVLPPEATQPRVWPEHAPLRAKVEEQSATAAQAGAPKTVAEAKAPAAQAAKAARTQESGGATEAAEPARPAAAPAPTPPNQAAVAPVSQAPQAGEPTAADKTPQTPPAEASPQAPPQAQANAAAETPAEAPPKAAAKAEAAPYKGGRVLHIAAVEEPSGYRVYLTTSAPVEKAQVFSKKSPPAVGIDLFGPWTAPPQTALPGGEGFADRLRIGAHPDKLRVMIDLKSDQISRKATFETLRNGVVIILGK